MAYADIKKKVKSKGYKVSIEKQYLAKGYPKIGVVKVKKKGWDWRGSESDFEKDYKRGMFD